jgi:hypothetical protein
MAENVHYLEVLLNGFPSSSGLCNDETVIAIPLAAAAAQGQAPRGGSKPLRVADLGDESF